MATNKVDSSGSAETKKTAPIEDSTLFANNALGIVETCGLTASIEAADAMLKSANVELIGTEKIGSGLVSVFIQGDVSAVKAATEAAQDAASRLGEIIAVHVIPRPQNDIRKLFMK